MTKEERPYKELKRPELKSLAAANWSDIDTLQKILSELENRKLKGAIDLRISITERLTELSDDSFSWPPTAVISETEALSNDNYWDEDGLLSFLGYRVGKKGASDIARRIVLDYVFNEKIPNVKSLEYMAEWGEPKTMIRLKKLSESIASLARNGKRKKTPNMFNAILEWEKDLFYLKKKYYDGVFDYSWPQT